MTREETEQYEQDRLGNVNRKLDELRAQEGMVGVDTDDGIAEIASAETGAVQLLYSLPTHADQVMLDLVHAFNSVPTSPNTFSLWEVTLNGSNSIVSSTRRSVPINVASGATRAIGYEGLPFDQAIGVSADFQGMVGAAVIVDHNQSSEPDIENTGTP